MPKNNGRNNGVPLVPQPHGGALAVGGTPGNIGGGRPPSAIRGSLRQILDDSLDMLRKISRGEADLREKCPECGHKGGSLPFRVSDVTKAIDVAGKYGLGEAKVDEEFVRELASGVGEVLGPQPNGEELLRAVHERWKPVLAKRL